MSDAGGPPPPDLCEENGLKKRTMGRAWPLLLGVLGACDTASEPWVARAAGRTLTVSEVAALTAGTDYPNEVQVPLTLGELWMDYVLLATAIAEDPTLEHLDISRVVDQQAEQELLLTYREATLQPDTTVSDAEVETYFSRSAPGVQARVRHIFLATPQGASQAVRDSLREVAASLRARVAAGEDFEALAREYSEDTGTAPLGGDLGLVERGELFGSLDSAAFSLQPGEVSEVLESVYGLHVVRVDERAVPELDSIRPELRLRIQQERFLAAESVMVASAEEGADVEIVEGAAALAREAARDPAMELSRRAAGRALVRFEGGELTLRDVLWFMQTRQPQLRMEIYGSSDEVIEENLLRTLARRRLLARAATEAGFEITDARRDSIASEFREQLLGTARELDLTELPPGDDEESRDVRERHVRDLLRALLQGTRQVMPLGVYSYILRDEYGAEVSFEGAEAVVERVDQVGGGAPDAGAPQGPPATEPALPAPGAPPTGGQEPPPDGGLE